MHNNNFNLHQYCLIAYNLVLKIWVHKSRIIMIMFSKRNKRIFVSQNRVNLIIILMKRISWEIWYYEIQYCCFTSEDFEPCIQKMCSLHINLAIVEYNILLLSFLVVYVFVKMLIIFLYRSNMHTLSRSYFS